MRKSKYSLPNWGSHFIDFPSNWRSTYVLIRASTNSLQEISTSCYHSWPHISLPLCCFGVQGITISELIIYLYSQQTLHDICVLLFLAVTEFILTKYIHHALMKLSSIREDNKPMKYGKLSNCKF